MTVLSRPAQVRYVNHAVDSGFYLQKSAEIGHAAYSCGDNRPGRVFLGRNSPGIGLRLLESQRNLLLLSIDAEHDDFDFIPEINHLARMRQSLGPAHLADMHKTFDPVFETNKDPVIHDVDNPALNLISYGIACFNVFPRAGGLLFQAQRDLLMLFVNTHDYALDLLIELDRFGRM